MKLFFGIFLLFITPALMKGGSDHPENIPCGIIVGLIGIYLCWRWWTDRNAAPAQAVSPARPDPAPAVNAPAPEAQAVPEPPRSQRRSASCQSRHLPLLRPRVRPRRNLLRPVRRHRGMTRPKVPRNPIDPARGGIRRKKQ